METICTCKYEKDNGHSRVCPNFIEEYLKIQNEKEEKTWDRILQKIEKLKVALLE